VGALKLTQLYLAVIRDILDRDIGPGAYFVTALSPFLFFSRVNLGVKGKHRAIDTYMEQKKIEKIDVKLF